MSGIHIFPSVLAALNAGYEVPHPAYPDSEGLVRVRIKMSAGWGMALARVNGGR